ncbi:MAG: DUF3014 domain-containing protein [Methylococcales bacterium]|nr:DUF3014 domain-containing protein [Methylococcales bacterium]MDD5632304.1 DUF3014 domain-containing protein [Methylococcales bacterium]
MGRYQRTENKKPVGVIVVITLILIGLAGGGWFYFDNLKQEEGAVSETKNLSIPPASEISIDESELEPESINNWTPEIEAVNDDAQALQNQQFVLPELRSSDGPFREAIIRVSPGLVPWLNTSQLIRKYVLIANDFSQGLWLEKHMRFLKPDQPFTVEETDNGMFISHKSYQRYDGLAAAINAMDVQSSLAIYKNFRPLFQQVFAEFSYPPEHQLKDILLKAAAEILAAPTIKEPIALVRPSVLYKFADKKLETLSPVSKQMIRMGPENTRIIQNKVRLLVEELANMEE